MWTFGQQFGTQAIGFLISIVLARLLLPKEFGLIGMISVFIGIGTSLVNSGLTQSLIRTVDPDQEDYSTVFFLISQEVF
jgi:O-antigen/teichoic acid export membrane protein